MKKDTLKKVILICAVVLVIAIILINPVKVMNKAKLNKLKYNKTSIENIIKYDLTEKTIKLGYNKTLDVALKSKDFKKKYADDYSKITYVEQKDFIPNINKLLDEKYTTDEINHINKTANDDTIKYILSKDKNEILEYLKIDYSKASHLNRYSEYKLSDKGKDKTNEEIVTEVNIGIDKDFYEETIELNKFDNTMLVNKYRKLPDDFKPKDLVKIDSNYATDENQSATKETVSAFIKMAKDMEKENLHIIANSSYRDSDTQKEMYKKYDEKYGGQYAKAYAAVAGYSEHQTGLVIDMANKDHQIFDGTKEFQWLKKNAYKYGFILRYPNEKENITGYSYEPWHYRYIGSDLAKKVVDSKLTYDEYYIKYLDK